MLHALRDSITGEMKPVDTEGPARHYARGVARIGMRSIEGMHGVMHGARGTARAVGLNAPFQMAGKSGTAQVFTVAQNQKYKSAEVARAHA